MNQDAPNLAENRFDWINCPSCFDCMTKFATAPSLVLLSDYLRDGTCELSCENGHKTVVCLQQFPFEIHFQIGALALLDGYYAESTFAFAKALERFYEFCIKLFSLEDVLPGVFEMTWKSIKKQSERQLGAFIFLYLKKFKECPPIFSDQKFSSSLKCSEFRNNVIHQGYLPSKDQAFAYGQMIFEYIQQLIVKLRKEDKDKIQKLTGLHLRSLIDKNKAINPTTMGGGGILFLARDDIEELSFERELESLKQVKVKQQQLQEAK